MSLAHHFVVSHLTLPIWVVDIFSFDEVLPALGYILIFILQICGIHLSLCPVQIFIRYWLTRRGRCISHASYYEVGKIKEESNECSVAMTWVVLISISKWANNTNTWLLCQSGVLLPSPHPSLEHSKRGERLFNTDSSYNFWKVSLMQLQYKMNDFCTILTNSFCLYAKLQSTVFMQNYNEADEQI